MGLMPFTARMELGRSAATIALSGELDMAAAPILEEHLVRAEPDGAAAILIDGRDPTFVPRQTPCGASSNSLARISSWTTKTLPACFSDERSSVPLYLRAGHPVFMRKPRCGANPSARERGSR